jgi:hypothetical protein
MRARHLSTPYIVLLTAAATLVVVAVVALLTGVIEVQLPQQGAKTYQQWYQRDGRAAVIYTISPVVARLMDCANNNDPIRCTCAVQMRNQSDVLAQAEQYASQAPVGYAATHSVLEDGLAQYESLRQNVQNFCQKPNANDYDSIKAAVLHYADVRNVLMSRLQKQP